MSLFKKDLQKFFKDIKVLFDDVCEDFSNRLDAVSQCNESKLCAEESSISTITFDLEKDKNESYMIERKVTVDSFEEICPFSVNKIDVCCYYVNAEMDLMNDKYRFGFAGFGADTSHDILNRIKLKGDSVLIDGMFTAVKNGLFSFIYDTDINIFRKKVFYSDDAWWIIKNSRIFLTGNVRYRNYLSIKQGLMRTLWNWILAVDYTMLDYVQDDFFFRAKF